MLIDPKRPRKRRHPSNPTPVAPVVIVALAAEVACLAELRNWMPVGSRLEGLTGALHGQDGFTRFDVTRLRTMAANWRPLASDVRTFYAENHGERGVSNGLWYILGIGRKPSGMGIGFIRRAFTDANGYSPNIDLLPKPATQDLK